MDYRCGIIAAVVCAGLISDCRAEAGKQVPDDLNWISTSDDAVAVITRRPPECINPDSHNNAEVRLGRLAFESPALLGGQASRMGLSCASCHPAARSNKHFFIDGISSTPGTADVTHSFLSTRGGNRHFDPVPIPDLAVAAQMKIPDRHSAAFREKLVQLIEIEFDGQPALKTVLDGLQIYLQNIDQAYCSEAGAIGRTGLSSDWLRLEDALAAINQAVEQNDTELAGFLIRVARRRLEAIYQRFGNLADKQASEGLVKLSRGFEQVGTADSDEVMRRRLQRVQEQAGKLMNELMAREPESLYDERVLREFLARNK